MAKCASKKFIFVTSSATTQVILQFKWHIWIVDIMSHLKYFYHISATVVNRMVDARPCNVFVVLRRVSNSRTIIIIIRPTAKNRDQLRNPTLGNQVWATFFYAYSAMQCTWTAFSADFLQYGTINLNCVCASGFIWSIFIWLLCKTFYMSAMRKKVNSVTVVLYSVQSKY